MPQILDQYGRPIEQAVLHEAQTAQLGGIYHSFAEHPSKGLTPLKLHRILEAAERGDLAAQADLFLDMEEKDGHIYAEMSKRKRALLTLDWHIEPPRNASTREQKEAAQLEEWLSDLTDFEDVLLDALDAIGHGFAAQEIEWQRLGKDWLPKTITHRPQSWFQTLPDDGNALRLRDGSAEGAQLWPFGWLLHTHKAKSGYVTRGGLHRVLAWPYLFKNYSVRDLAEFLEIYGLPLRLGKYPPGATDAEKNTLLRAVAGIGHNAAGIIPEGMMIEFQAAAQGSHEPFKDMRQWCENIQSKAILGGTLTSQADGKTSTNALGEIHNEVRHDLMVSDARQLETSITTDLLYPLSVLNFGQTDPRRRCRLKIDTRAAEDLALYAESLPSLAGMGVKIPVSWVHEKLAIPEPVNDEPVLSVARPEMVPPPALRPETETAPLTYRAVLQNERGEIVTPDQHAIDQIQLPVDQINTGMDAILKPVIEALQQGASEDEASDILNDMLPHMDASQIRELIARALFVTDVWGRLNGDS